MPGFTLGGIQYPIAGDLIKQSSVDAKIASDMEALAKTASTYIDAGDWMKDVIIGAGDSFANYIGTGKQVKGKVINATGAAGVGDWPVGLAYQGAIFTSRAIASSVSLQTLQTYNISSPQFWIRSAVGTGGQAWTRIGVPASDVEVVHLSASQDLFLLDVNGLKSKKWSLAAIPTDATAQHLPTGERGTIEMTAVGSARLMTYLTWEAKPRLFAAYKSTTWGEWTQIGGPSNPSSSDTTDVDGSGFKAVGLPLTVGHSGTDAPLSGTYRIPIDWLAADVPITRAKVRLRNINIRSGVTRAGSISLEGIWIGTPDANGHFGATPTQVAPALTFNGADGYESPWFDVPGRTLTDKAISYAYTASSAPWAQYATGWYDADQVGGSTGNTGFASSPTAAFTVDLIVETYSTTPVLATIGDSNSVGVGAEYLRDSWGARLANRLKAIPQILGSSGDTAEGSVDASAYKWNRFPACTKADTLLFALGQNDAAGIRTLAQIEGYMAAAAQGAPMVARRTYGVSLMPRTNNPITDFEARRRTISGWLKEQRYGFAGYVDIVPAMSSDDETILPAYDYDGTHLNKAGHQAVADRIATTYAVASPPVQYVVV